MYILKAIDVNWTGEGFKLKKSNVKQAERFAFDDNPYAKHGLRITAG